MCFERQEKKTKNRGCILDYCKNKFVNMFAILSNFHIIDL